MGHIELQKLTKAHLDDLVTYMQKSGRRVGNVQRKGLGPRSIQATLTRLEAVLEDAVRQGTLSRNVATLVERPAQIKREMNTWTAEQASQFLQAVTSERLSAALMFSLNRLRRGEVLGLRWSDINLDAKTVTVKVNRVDVAGLGTVETPPKTERGKRTLPLDDGLIAALRALRTQQFAERLAAGQTYTTTCADCGGEHLVVDELGRPYRPEWYSDTFIRLFKAAGLPAIRLHDARHTCGTLMHLRGVPTAVISKWMGHSPPRSPCPSTSTARTMP